MPPPPHIKPENVLKRAQELIGVGQSPAALAVLHEHVTSKRSRNSPIASLEPVMLLFVELSVDLKKGKSAKDGLYHYKNIAQNTNVGTIELVLKKFIDLAEQKVTNAQAKAEEIQSSLESTTATTNVEDLEAIETPETILLATVSGEQSKDRTDRAIVTPWLKFLWETYRTVLEILKNNARLEILYQTTALQAFQFCLKYTRKTEFRRLCELLRNHVQNAAKYSSQMHAINLNDPDTLQRHLDTRFQQLNVAVELELWQEAFRSVEDIYYLLNLSKRPAKNIMMANYFEKLTKIFLVSENFLFHAASWSRYYNLLRVSMNAVASGQSPKKDNPSVTDVDMINAASFVLLSALSIPVISTSRSRGALIDVDEVRKNKNSRLTNLLSMNTAPTRLGLLKDALNKGLLKRARPEIRDLYNILEVDFHPLSICKKISPILTQIGADPEMKTYVVPLQQVILTRLFQQLSQVYESVELSFVYSLAQFPEPFQVSTSMIEKFIMNGCKKGDLSIRLDHVSGILTFDSDVFSSAKALHPGSAAGSAESEVGSVQRLQNTPAEIARSQLSRLAKTLHVTCVYVDPSYNATRVAAKQEAFARAQQGAGKEHEEALARRAVIEKKKEAASDALQKKQKEEELMRAIRAQQASEAERARLAEEQKKRELKRIQEEQKRIRQLENEKALKELEKGGVDVKSIQVDDLDVDTIRGIKLQQLAKNRAELDDRIKATAKRIDHLERAFRREEIKHLPDDYEKQRVQDLEAHETQKADTMKEAQRKHKEGLALKHRLGRLVSEYDQYKSDLTSRRHEEFEKRRRTAEREFENQKRERIRKVQEDRKKDRLKREEEERQKIEEEQRLAREAEEKAAKEEEQRRKLAERRAQMEEERSRLDEKARLQAEREREAEERRAARKAGVDKEPLARPSAPERAPERAEAGGERTAPRLQLSSRTGGGPSWRDREKARGTGEDMERTPSQDTQMPRKSGYVPPHQRRDGANPVRDTQRDTPPRDASPANGGPKYVPSHLRDGRSSSRDAPSPTATQSPQEGTKGRWVPPHKRT
ncbi:MAG: hypothetical protein Q9160_002014 [Pyrenula sp. 1 TL-2023]